MSRLLVPLLAFAFLAGCASGPRVHVEQSPDSNFASFRTFNFHEEAGIDESAYETTVAGYIKRAITENMTARGYSLSSEPDLLINFRLGDQERIESRGGPSLGIGIGYGNPHWAVGYNTRARVRSYTEGSLTIDLVDRARNMAVWTGTALERVTNADRDNAGRAAEQAVMEIFLRYPYGAGGASYTPPVPN
jgi:Domain of unknown function (DUF4136)